MPPPAAPAAALRVGDAHEGTRDLETPSSKGLRLATGSWAYLGRSVAFRYRGALWHRVDGQRCLLRPSPIRQTAVTASVTAIWQDSNLEVEAAIAVYPVVHVPDTAAELTEQLGTKPKFWFRWEGNVPTLFKEARPGTGEDWAEKVAAELAALLDLPHAHYELAEWHGRRGVTSPTFVPSGGRLVHGNELIAQAVEDYPESDFFRVRQHTLGVVMAFVALDIVAAPIGFEQTANLKAGADVFVGYLMLDAWIGNQDRHHENWALIRHPRGEVALAPSYDHASSLGRNESDENRRERLTTRDHGRSVAAYVDRARSALYGNAEDTKPLKTLEAFIRAGERRPAAAVEWLDRLAGVTDDQVAAIFASVPSRLISEFGIEFASQMLALNKERLQFTREALK